MAWRLDLVQRRIAEALDRLGQGPIRVISLCGGQGRDLIGALTGHDRTPDVSARLVELDPRNANQARSLVAAAGLTRIEVVAGDASTTAAFEGAVPAEVIVACGIFGNISDGDIHNTVANLACRAAPGATVLWTRHRGEPDVTPQIRTWFADAGWEEIAFDVNATSVQTVGVHRLTRSPDPFVAIKLFDFSDYDALPGSGGGSAPVG